MSLTKTTEKSKGSGIMSLQDFYDGRKNSDTAHMTVVGDCMEGFGICDGDIVKVDFRHMPKPPKYLKRDGEQYSDACLCYGTMPGQKYPCVMVKQYCGVMGYMQLVGTRYKRSGENLRMDCAFEPLAILGVVCAVYDSESNLKWERDTSLHPEEIGTKSTIKGVGISDPIRINEIKI